MNDLDKIKALEVESVIRFYAWELFIEFPKDKFETKSSGQPIKMRIANKPLAIS